MTLLRSLALLLGLLVVLPSRKALARAQLLNGTDLVDMDGDGDIDADDLLSLEQIRIHNAMENVAALPAWAGVDFFLTGEQSIAASNGTRFLEALERKTKRQSFLQDVVQQDEPLSTDRMHRQTRKRKRASITATNGFCLPPEPVSGSCQRRAERCGGSQGQCCAGLKCKDSSDGFRCRRCKNRGRECSSNSVCCSQQCVECNSNCEGYCGLGTESARDDIQAFYYPWYLTPDEDGKWKHWAIDGHPEGGPFSPDDEDLPTNYYPRLGAYSSSDDDVLELHMRWLKRAGVGTIQLSWWGVDSDEDKNVKKILDAAADAGLKVGFYIEPYKGGYVDPDRPGGTRTPRTAREDVKYLIDTYGCHQAIYRRDGRPVFMFFAARSYMDGAQDEWAEVWEQLHNDERYNPIVIAHDVNLELRILKGGWDGGHDYGTAAARETSEDWEDLAREYAAEGKILYFTVSPGYDNTRLDEDEPIISRRDGDFYDEFWQRAIDAKRDSNPVIITSFNEWHEGTQIEPCIEKSIPSYRYDGDRRPAFTYKDYEGDFGLDGEDASFAYIDKTKEFADDYLDA